MAEQPENAALPPVVIDLGKVGRRRIRKLKKGRGRLVDEVHEVADLVREELGEELAGREILPVVLIYRKKRRKRKSLFAW